MEEIKFTDENNEIENSSLKRIGNFIKEARLSRNKSIEELASDLKIGAHQLKAIEDGNQEQLPEKVFIKAMVRRISQKLKIDTDFINNEFSSEKKVEEIDEKSEETAQKDRKSKNPKNINPLGLGLFILIAGFLGFLSSSLIFNLFLEFFENQTPKQELLKKTK